MIIPLTKAFRKRDLQPEFQKVITEGLRMFCCFTADVDLAVRCYTLFCPEDLQMGEQRLLHSRSVFHRQREDHKHSNAEIGKDFIQKRDASSQRRVWCYI
jgi:hypothetical protein